MTRNHFGLPKKYVSLVGCDKGGQRSGWGEWLKEEEEGEKTKKQKLAFLSLLTSTKVHICVKCTIQRLSLLF